MTEAEWLACEYPRLMLEFLGDGSSPRKLRLFAAAACRSLWDQLPGENSRKAVLVAEQFADGLVSKRDLTRAGSGARHSPGIPSRAARNCAYADDWIAALWTSDVVVAGGRSASELAVLVRDVFANPFGPVALDLACVTSTVASLAQSAYGDRILPSGELDPVRLSILADALEDAGCDGATLSHLRSAGPHVRGCWALDLILGKE
jgi:hypothetical protein